MTVSDRSGLRSRLPDAYLHQVEKALRLHLNME